jgi:hypothetical protein
MHKEWTRLGGAGCQTAVAAEACLGNSREAANAAKEIRQAVDEYLRAREKAARELSLWRPAEATRFANYRAIAIADGARRAPKREPSVRRAER